MNHNPDNTEQDDNGVEHINHGNGKPCMGWDANVLRQAPAGQDADHG